MISVKNGVLDFKDMQIEEFIKWLKKLNKSIGDCWKICVHVEIGEKNG